VLGHLRSQRTAKLQIFTCWSLSAPTDIQQVEALDKHKGTHITRLLFCLSSLESSFYP